LSLDTCKLYKSLAPPHFRATHDQIKKGKMGSACNSQGRDDIWVWMWKEDIRVDDRITVTWISKERSWDWVWDPPGSIWQPVPSSPKHGNEF
jgi:hypothetical protein